MTKLLKALEALTTKHKAAAVDEDVTIAEPDDATCTNLLTWYNDFAHLVHMHHDIEETVFVPFLKAHGAALGDKIAKSHVELVAELDALQRDIAAVRGLDRASRPAALEAIAATARVFVADMRAHLREEEDTVIPAAVNHLTAKDEKELIGIIVKGLKLSTVPG